MALAEGAGILMLEDFDYAVSRGAPIYAEIAGFACCSDMNWRGSSNQSRLQDCIQQALERAEIAASDIDHVMAEGVGSKADDEIEASALRAAFGSHRPTVSVPKSTTGHMLSEAGPIDCAWACLMIERNLILPTASLREIAPECELNHIAHTTAVSPINHVLCVSRGYGGTNAALILRRFSGNPYSVSC